jgi:hypothetical protein
LLLADAEPEEIGYAALRGGVALKELRLAQDGNSLEELFFQLTADDRPASSGTPASTNHSINVPEEALR